MDLQLHNKRALITGGSRGIGYEIARVLAEEGADVAITGRDATRAETAARALADATGRRVIGLAADTKDDAAVRAAVDAMVEAFGGVDILVNNAAEPGSITPPGPLEGIDDDLLLEDLDVKVIGYLRAARAVAPHMINAGWGRIVNISGLGARTTGRLAGSVRNVGVVALAKNLADELGPQGINVTVVHPGLTVTERTDHSGGRPSAIGRIVTAEEVAWLVAFLASPRSVAVNGSVIDAGGGTKGPIFY